MNTQIICHICGIPVDAGYFDEANMRQAPSQGQEIVLARYQLHRNYCGVLTGFTQYTQDAQNNSPIQTPGYQWQIRCNGRPRDPYLTFEFVLNSWGDGGFPVQLRLEEACLVELAVRNVNGTGLATVGGRIIGRYWYNTEFGGAPNQL